MRRTVRDAETSGNRAAVGFPAGGVRDPWGPQLYVTLRQCDFARGGRPMRGQTFNNGHSGQRGFRAVQMRRP